MPDQAIEDFIQSKRALLVPELNFSGQFGRMIEHRYYRSLDENNIHVYQCKKEQGVPFKISELTEAVLDMIESEHKLWAREHGELAKIYRTVDRIRSEAQGGNGD
jgi:hypothetical protein